MSNNNKTRLTLLAGGLWKPAKEKDREFRYIIHRAPTQRARCRKCGLNVGKGELRIGIPIRHSAGEHGWISAWQHVNCTRVDTPSDDLTEVMSGFTDLSTEQQTEVAQTITSTDLPAHLKPLNPDDLLRRGRLEPVDPPTAMLRPLLLYQREGYGWMLEQEQTKYKGGILADEMGMGKTIQMISLILGHRLCGPTLVVCPVSSMLQWKAEIEQHVVAGTLSVVVVYRTTKITKDMLENADVVLTTYPMIEQAWRQLVNETKLPCQYCGQLFIPRQLSVHNRYFCGPLAKKTAKQLKREKNADEDPADGASVALESGPDRPTVVPRSRTVQSAKTIRKGLRTLHVDIDEDEAEDAAGATNADGSVPGGSIMGPMGMYRELMQQAGRRVRSRWEGARWGSSSSSDSASDTESTESKADEVVYGSDEEAEAMERRRREEEEDLAKYRCSNCGFQLLRFPFCPRTGQHHILTDALMRRVESDSGADVMDLSKSLFHSIKWTRIVLDEAHRIKGRTTSTSRSAFALEAEHRWCLTGTPLQNRVGDVYSLLRFLRMEPFAHYYCLTEGCSCCSLSHPFSGTSLRQCIFCGHGPVQHYAYFNRNILNPITRYGYVGDGRQGMMMLVNEVLNKIMLRRTKVERAEDLHLPPLVVDVIYIQLSDEERNFYESLYKKSTAVFDTFVSKGTMLHNYAHIFQLLSRLRQALDHPLLVLESMNVGKVVHPDGLCGICQEANDGENFIRVTPCRHGFHRVCLSQFLESAPGSAYTCPTCFVTISVDLRQLQEDWGEGGAFAALPPEFVDDVAAVEDGSDTNDSPVTAELINGLDAASAAPSPKRLKAESGAVKNEEDIKVIIEWDSAEKVATAADLGTRGAQVGADEAEPLRTAKGRRAGGKCGPKAGADISEGPHKARTPERLGILSRIDPLKALKGTKLDAIASYIQSVPNDEKVIVFSQFGDMLDLTQHWLQKRFVKSVKLTGSLTLSQRQAVLTAFQTEPSVRVILISLKAGGEGLNLQVANHVVLADPWWNPAVEMQAVQRAHRIGQTRHVRAVRFVTENSVEERMVALQDKKMLVFEGTVDGKLQALQHLSEEDLQFLFTR